MSVHVYCFSASDIIWPHARGGLRPRFYAVRRQLKRWDDDNLAPTHNDVDVDEHDSDMARPSCGHVRRSCQRWYLCDRVFSQEVVNSHYWDSIIKSQFLLLVCGYADVTVTSRSRYGNVAIALRYSRSGSLCSICMMLSYRRDSWQLSCLAVWMYVDMYM